ncbi:hypothetical protein CCACVL1_07123 [Corchorus capsularis]|uniref:Uncharacterized protein n=1 Tax=Corchorus capsularis TaxID=210143 RepID=A0A1R3J998_COCAP|nr:hypothetical protein CCACVL1_07123 [Corchorus capsularis]
MGGWWPTLEPGWGGRKGSDGWDGAASAVAANGARGPPGRVRL